MPLIIEGKECACLGDPTTHGSPLAPGIGAVTVLYNGRPIWRVGMDFHACPIVKGVVPDVGGVVAIGAMRTIVMGAPAARKLDIVMEVPGGPNPILPGAFGVGGMAGAVQDAQIAIGRATDWAVDAFESPAVQGAPQSGDPGASAGADAPAVRLASPPPTRPLPPTPGQTPPANRLNPPPPPPRPSVTTGLGVQVDVQVAKSPKFKKRIEDLQKDGWTIRYGDSGQGSYCARTAKEIVIDRDLEHHRDLTLQMLAHEAGHAGYTPDPYVPHHGQDRDTYVRSNLARDLKDEGEATLTNIEFRDDLVAHGGPDVGVAGTQAARYEEIAKKYPDPKDRDQARQEIGAIYAHHETPSGHGTTTYQDHYAKPYEDHYDLQTSAPPLPPRPNRTLPPPLPPRPPAQGQPPPLPPRPPLQNNLPPPIPPRDTPPQGQQGPPLPPRPSQGQPPQGQTPQGQGHRPPPPAQRPPPPPTQQGQQRPPPPAQRPPPPPPQGGGQPPQSKPPRPPRPDGK